MPFRRRASFFLGSVVAWVFISVSSAGTQSTTTVVAVDVPSQDAVIQYAKISAKRVPVPDFDLGSLLADELVAQFSSGSKATWRVATKEDAIDVRTQFENKNRIATPIKVDRILLVSVTGYGIYRAWGTSPRFVCSAELKFVDGSNKKIWSARGGEDVKLKGEIEDQQKKNAKGLKEGLNECVVKLSTNMAKKHGTKVQ